MHTFVDPIKRALQIAPDKLAVIDGEQQFTFAQLYDRSARLVQGLRNLGLADGDRVAILADNSHVYMETYLGDFERMKKAYVDFLHNLPFYGLAILCFDDPVIRQLASQITKPVVSYGFEEGVDFRATNLTQDGATSYFQVEGKNMQSYSFFLRCCARRSTGL